MVNKELLEIINSDSYIKVLQQVVIKTGIEVEKNNPSFSILNYDIGKSTKANISFSDLEEILLTDNEKISAFSIAKLEKYKDEDEEKDEGDDYEDEEDDDDETTELAFEKNFLISYLLEYYLILKRPNDLEKYLRNIRIPNAKKYAKELMLIYKEL